MEYQIVFLKGSLLAKQKKDPPHEQLARKVNDVITEGWMPLGSVSTTMLPGVIYMSQAMVKDERLED